MVGRPALDGLSEAAGVLREWPYDGAPLQLHPGDLGWFWRFGAEAAAAAVRTWRRDGQVLAIGLLDEPGLLRLAIAPRAQQDDELARQLTADLDEPACGVLPAGTVYVEAPRGALVRDLLAQRGWQAGEPWTPLCRDLAEPVPDPGVRVEVIGPAQAHVRAAVQRAAFERSTFTEERWYAMAAGVAYADAAVTVWSAGPGKPGLLEPMGVHRDHRGRGYGNAITVAAAAALRELGSSSALVRTRSADVGAVATYRSAGFRARPETCDRRREG